ncbi:hypothetical protein MXY26_003074 [Salmonella enterica]|nr:hypothetical protein [Salmonella enterica]EJC0927526.1 hypothetical protein [Salmonella enterica]
MKTTIAQQIRRSRTIIAAYIASNAWQPNNPLFLAASMRISATNISNEKRLK